MLVIFHFTMDRTSSIPNYRETTSKYADLTAIHGEPTYDSLTILNEEQQLLSWSYYNKIDDLMDLANIAGLPYSLQHVINMGYIILNKTGKFTNGIREWNCIPPNQRTWDVFQTYFSHAHWEL